MHTFYVLRKIFSNHDVLGIALIVIAVTFISIVLDGIPRGRAYAVNAQECKVQTSRGEVACTGMRRDYGLPFITSSKLTQLKAADGESFVPQAHYICWESCSDSRRDILSKNFFLILGIAIVFTLARRFYTDRWIDKKLVEQWVDDNRRNPTKPGKD